MKQYATTTLLLALYLTKRFFRDKLGLFFTIAFPLVFLIVFGYIFSGDDDVSFDIVLINRAETEFATEFVTGLEESDIFAIDEETDRETAETRMGRGELSAIVELPEDFGTAGADGVPRGDVEVYFDESRQDQTQAVISVLQGVVDEVNAELVPLEQPLAIESQPIQTAGLTQFDYVFPGLLGFTILSLGVFGLANTLPMEKKNGNLRQLRATPLRASQLIIATALQYLCSGLIAMAIMFTVGVVWFDFEMRGDYGSLLIIGALGTLLMITLGLAVSGWAKNENQAAPLANIVALPMFFLTGVFSPRFIMPEWLQTVSEFLPLTPIIEGMRLIMTEGETWLDISGELAAISIWLVATTVIAAYVFRWG